MGDELIVIEGSALSSDWAERQHFLEDLKAWVEERGRCKVFRVVSAHGSILHTEA